MVSLEIERFAFRQRIRVEGPFFQNTFFAPDLELINETKKRFLLILGFINGGILVISGGLAYYLAGKTLKPIRDMVDEQNRFISDSSHELRTPLATLKTTLEVNLRDPKLTLKNAKKLVKESITEVNQLQSLSDELLQLAQYQKPNSHPQLEKTSLDQIVLDVVRKLTPLAKSKNITIQNRVKDINVIANKYALADLLTILIDNAIKYSSPGKKIIITAVKHDHSVEFSVIDHGIGIDRHDLPHLFDRFYRADTARSKDNTSGYGLGLSIAKKIVDNHHASIEVKSRLGRGSTFSVKLQSAGSK